MVNVFYDGYRVLMRIYSQKAYIGQAINSEVIEPLNRSLVIKICYGVAENDIYLEYVLSKLCDKRPKLPVRVIIKEAIFCLKFLNKTPYAVTDAAVELLKKLGKGANSGFANAVLRKFIALGMDVPLPAEKTDKLSVLYSYPRFAVELLTKFYGEKTAVSIMSYRVVHNYVRFAGMTDGKSYLDDRNLKYDVTPFFNLFDVKNFTRNEDYDKGIYTFQSIGSVAICDVVPDGDFLIDCCAAPGGKSVLLAERFKKVTALEIYEHRAELIKNYSMRMHVHNIDVKTNDSTVFIDDYFEKADVVLCDCPCSGFGVVSQNPDIKFNRDYDNIAVLGNTQVEILENCCKYVKRGGFLIYSTCSVFNEENDLTIERFNPEKHGFVIQDIRSPLDGLKTLYGVQFLPHISKGAGFYVCKMKKN